MIKRYSTERISKIWSDKNKFDTYLKVEIAAVKSWYNFGLISKKELNLIESKAKVNLERLREIEKETKHDVIAFTRTVSESLGEEKKWIHYGLTSTDVVDTAYAIQLKEANNLILKSLLEFTNVLKEKAFKYKEIPVMGRTHGVHAEITSLGLKFALWYDEMQRNINRFKGVSKNVEIGKISGAVGNFANTPAQIQDQICTELKIGSAKISTQILQRDRHSHYISVLAIIGSTLEKIAIEVRNSQRTEVSEMIENFSKGQKGSSAMPHKKNPISSENICGIARILRGYVIPAMENNALWYERDISHSSVERVIIPDATNLIDYALKRYSKTIENLYIDEKQMKNNINITQGVIFSQRVLNLMIQKGMSREASYDIIQPIAIQSWEKKTSFFDLLSKNEFIMKKITKKELESLFDIKYFLKEVDVIFDRVFKEKQN